MTQPLGQIQTRVESFSGRVGTVLAGSFTVASAAMGAFLVSSAKAADNIGDAADRMGVAVESLSRLNFAAQQSDVDFSSLTVAVKRWQVLLSQAASGQKEAADSLGLIQIKAGQLKGLKLEDQLARIADQFKRIQDPADKTRVAVELFGRSGEQLVPLLNQGGDAIHKFAAESDALGATLDSRTTQSVDRLDKAAKKLLATLQAIGARGVGRIAEFFGGPADEADALEDKLRALIKQRDELLNPTHRDNRPQAQRLIDLNSINSQILETQRALDGLVESRNKVEDKPLVIPVDTKATQKLLDSLEMVRVSESLLKDPLIEWEEQTRTSSERVARDFDEFAAKLDQLVKAGKLSPAEAAKRQNEKLDDVLQPIQISVQRLQVPLTKAQERAKAFTDTLKTGLENAARAGELTGKSILRNILAAFEAKIIYDAIDKLANYVSNALFKSTSTSGGGGGNSAGSFIGSVIGGLFGHNAGGGRYSGLTVVGEDGPELVAGSGQVFNRRQMAFAGGGSSTVNMGDTNIVINGASNPALTAQLVEARIQASQRAQREWFSRTLRTNGFGDLR